MMAVTVMARVPPRVTLNEARPSGAPPKWAPNAPRAARLTNESTAITGICSVAGETRSPKIGIRAKVAKLTAETHAARTGRERDLFFIPSSSSMCAPSRSCALNCLATFIARDFWMPRFI